MSFLAAFRFLTVIPIPSRQEEDSGRIGRSAVWFPVVGLIIGLFLAGLNWLFNLFLPVEVVNGLLIVSLVIMTGALHLDGFVDTCDGLAGNKPAEERWKVMHDSRAGAFGITGVVLLLLMKYLLLNSIPREIMTFTLVLMPLTGRWAMVYAIVAYRYALDEGLGKAFKQSAGWGQFVTATVITLVLATGLAWCAGVIHYYLAGMVILVIIWLVVTGVSAYFSHKFAGLTGDTYGAINELAEIGVLAVVSIVIFCQWSV